LIEERHPEQTQAVDVVGRSRLYGAQLPLGRRGPPGTQRRQRLPVRGTQLRL